jgi:hypothetical protein
MSPLAPHLRPPDTSHRNTDTPPGTSIALPTRADVPSRIARILLGSLGDFRDCDFLYQGKDGRRAPDGL